ncbi:MAG: methyl-accepting chemotaxis protein [Deltaproteobacteria bacterium HGW-Deltaproteobacteria-8]|jgi:methyl-accepting chemotaxis protein|nr:MAG: methyl-accepting chemotaxis protein [Deltaproteobacteria bacterium HGW-Deltaproteobacteria-8]
MRRFGIKAKFLIPAVALVSIGFAVVIWLNANRTRIDMEAMLKESMTLLSESIAKDTGGDIVITYQMLNAWSDDEYVREAIVGTGASRASTHFANILSKMEGTLIQYVNIFDVKGDLLSTSAKGGVTKKVNVMDRDYFKAIIEDGKTRAIGKAIQSRTTGKKVIILSQKITATDGTLLGVITAAISLDELTAQINAMKIGSTGYVAIMEPSGMTVAHPNKELLLKDDLAKTELGKRALAVENVSYLNFEDHGQKSVAVRKEVNTGWTILVFAPIEDIQKAARESSQKSMLLGGGVALVLAFFISWLVNRTVAIPVSRCMGFASAVSEGDLDRKLDYTSTDELGVLADGLRHMVQTLKENMQKVQIKETEALQMAQKAENALNETRIAQEKANLARGQGLQEAAGKMSGMVQGVEGVSGALVQQVAGIENGADTQKARTTETATAMDEMNATILEISRNASTASLDAEHMRDTAQHGKDVVQRVVEAIGAVNGLSSSTRQQMHELGESVKGIGNILEVINDIADQTNLLALNAAIEAARAGDAGRGFAVVADEVRKLAEKTMVATKEVGQAISSVQSGSRQSIENVEHSNSAIEEANKLAEDSIESLEQVLKLAASTSDQIRAIATAAEEQSGASGEIDHAVKDIMSIAGSTLSAVEDCRKTIDNLAGLSEELRRIMREMENT